jgi:hypothetical protein
MTTPVDLRGPPPHALAPFDLAKGAEHCRGAGILRSPLRPGGSLPFAR